MAQKTADGFWLDKRGQKVHPDLVRADDQLKDELVEELLSAAQDLSWQIAQFKALVNEKIEDYFALLLQNYNMDGRAGSKKGNLTLEGFSGTCKVQIAMAQTLDFDEKLKVAKMKIDGYLEDITKDADPAIQTLINQAFEVDKKGNVDAKKIFALKAYDIQDARWVEAMDIIDESKQVASVKPYIRFYHRKSINDNYDIVPLDIAKLGNQGKSNA